MSPKFICTFATSDMFSKRDQVTNLNVTVLFIEIISRHISVGEQEYLLKAHLLYGFFNLRQEKSSGAATLTVCLNAQFVDYVFRSRIPMFYILAT